MSPMSYLDLHREVAEDIDVELASALEHLGRPGGTARTAVARLLEHRKLRHPLSVLPLLVHGIETGRTDPALPISAVHVLWWTSACYLDDLADGDGASLSGALTENEALLASVLTGTTLPLQIIQAQPFPDPVRGALAGELARGWAVAVDGQIDDMRGATGAATRDCVIETYRTKSGAPFSMITVMAAICAGSTSGKVALWRRFGDVFGILWQLFNDQEDILSGRNEDLLNGTVTYLLAGAVEDASPEAGQRLLDLCAEARRSEPARAELAGLLLSPAVLDRYRADIGAHRAEAHRILDDLGGDEQYGPVLRQLVDYAGQMLLEPAHAPQRTAGAAPPGHAQARPARRADATRRSALGAA